MDDFKFCVIIGNLCVERKMKIAFFLFITGWQTLSLHAIKQQQPVRDQPWEFLILAQFWPGTSCVYFEKEGCSVPSDVKEWTIHGLWPSRNATQQPEFCNSSMPFNYSQIESLGQQLDRYWHYYNKTGNRSGLWEHEWDKHGTCAFVLPSLQGELNYFSATLQLYSHLDILTTLSNVGIVPDQDTFCDLNKVFTAVRDAYLKIPQISCYYSNGKHYLDQVWLCYDKTLNLIDCPEAHPSQRHGKMGSFQEPDRSLRFESEALKDGRLLEPIKPHNYFIDCPKNNSALYIPIPRGQLVSSL